MSPELKQIIDELKNYDGPQLSFMEVCGTHTAAISENAIAGMISPKIRLISGPGCPVCVTVTDYIDRLCELCRQQDVTVVTFGDLMRVRGSKENLREAMADGGSVAMVYSPLEMLQMAENNPKITYVFAAVGFETTTPIYAILLEEAINRNLRNVKILPALKTMPPVISAVCESENTINGFLAPGHVAAITGSDIFVPLAEKYNLPFVVSGFEGEELLASIYTLVKCANKPVVKNLYKSVVTQKGNETALEKVNRFFEKSDAAWRGLGIIKGSGMALKAQYRAFDAGSDNLINDNTYNKACACGDVICGRKAPTECPLYGKICRPDSPQGACMVSMEGSCYNYYTNGRMA